MASVGPANNHAGSGVSGEETLQIHAQSDESLSTYKYNQDSIFGNHQEKTNYADSGVVLGNIQNLLPLVVSWWLRLMAKSIGWGAQSRVLVHGDDQRSPSHRGLFQKIRLQLFG
jgi:hypothetical protein